MCEAGMGKSRLDYEFLHSPQTQDWLVLESASVSYGKATPYFPVIELLKRYFRIEDADDARTIRAKATGYVLTLDEASQDTIPALLALAHLPEQRATREQAIVLRLALGLALRPLGDSGRILAALRETESLAVAPGRPPSAGPGFWLSGIPFLHQGRA